jgi:hypothetical protein
MLCFLPHNAHLPRECAREKKTASAVYFTSRRARDAINSEERERLALALGQRLRNKQANCRRTEMKIRIAPRPRKKGGSAWLAKRRLGAFDLWWGLLCLLDSYTPADTGLSPQDEVKCLERV